MGHTTQRGIGALLSGPNVVLSHTAFDSGPNGHTTHARHGSCMGLGHVCHPPNHCELGVEPRSLLGAEVGI